MPQNSNYLPNIDKLLEDMEAVKREEEDILNNYEGEDLINDAEDFQGSLYNQMKKLSDVDWIKLTNFKKCECEDLIKDIKPIFESDKKRGKRPLIYIEDALIILLM